MKLDLFKSMKIKRETAEKILEKIGNRKKEETSSKEHWQDVIFSSVLVLVGGVLLAVLYPQDILIETFSFTAYYILVVLPVFIIYAVLLVLTQPKNKGKGGKGKELKDLELVDKNTDIYDVRNIKL